MAIDYNALAKQAGAIQSTSPAGNTVNYDQLAQQAGAIQPQVPTQPEVSIGSAGQSLVPGSTLGSNLKALPGQALQAVKNVGNFFTGSEQGLGHNIADIITAPQAQQQASDSAHIDAEYLKTLIQLKRNAILKGDASAAQHYDSLIQNHQPTTYQAPSLPSTGEVAGNLLGTAADVLSAGTYGKATAGMKAGELAGKVAPTVATPTATTLGGKLADIGKQTAKNAGIGAGIGYAYDVAGNLQQGKTGSETFTPGMGTLTAGALPLVIGGVRAGSAISKESAPKFINSLIKPSQANFSYGKDPGRTVSELGITGNSLPDFATNIGKARQDIGAQLGAIYANPANASKTVDATDAIGRIDKAIADAAKGGKGNQGIVTALQNVKDGLLYEHSVNADGVIEKVGTQPRNLTNLNPQEAFALKDLVSQQTKFTGNPSDDKTVNTVLQSVYGDIKDKLNSAVGQNNPEVTKLNQQYADLTSAQLATQHRDAIVSRSNIISMPVKVGGATAIITALGTGGAAVPAILAGATVASLDKALESTAVKTRMAKWLGSQSPSTISKIVEKNPGIATTIKRLTPKVASQLGQP